MLSDYEKPVLFLSALAFLTFATFGVARLGMDMQPNGQMANCPFMVGTAICKMNPLEHIDAWQKVFTAMPTRDLFLAPLFAFVYLLLFQAVKRFPKAVSPIRLILYSPLEKDSSRTHPLQEIFSQGILHSKAF